MDYDTGFTEIIIQDLNFMHTFMIFNKITNSSFYKIPAGQTAKISRISEYLQFSFGKPFSYIAIVIEGDEFIFFYLLNKFLIYGFLYHLLKVIDPAGFLMPMSKTTLFLLPGLFQKVMSVHYELIS